MRYKEAFTKYKKLLTDGALVEVNRYSRAKPLRSITPEQFNRSPTLREAISDGRYPLKRYSFKFDERLEQAMQRKSRKSIHSLFKGHIEGDPLLSDRSHSLQKLSQSEQLTLSRIVTLIQHNSSQKFKLSTTSLTDNYIKPGKSIRELLLKAESLDFDIMAFRDATEGNELFSLIHFLALKADFQNTLNIQLDRLKTFSISVQRSYRENYYHNATHAADMLQALHCFITKTNLQRNYKIEKIELLGVYLAAACHDMDHPGHNNFFEVKTGSPLALRYNDKSPLENYHAASAFILLRDHSDSLLGDFSPEEFSYFRATFLRLVLCTDNSLHFDHITKLKEITHSPGKVQDDKNIVLCNLFHAADISNQCRPFRLASEWGRRIVSEFFDQGDRERMLDLPVSMGCDRHTVHFEQSQVNFISFFLEPMYGALAEKLPAMEDALEEVRKKKERWMLEIQEESK